MGEDHQMPTITHNSTKDVLIKMFVSWQGLKLHGWDHCEQIMRKLNKFKQILFKYPTKYPIIWSSKFIAISECVHATLKKKEKGKFCFLHTKHQSTNMNIES